VVLVAKGKEVFAKILEKYGIPSPRLGGYEYMVATNLLILEQLKKMTSKTKVPFRNS
jgi:hypothetical protein